MRLLSRAALPVALCVGGCAVPSAAQPAVDLFERHEIVTGAAERQTLLPGSFTGPGQAELAIVRVQTAAERRVQVHGLDGDGWSMVREARLDAEVLFVDVAGVAGRDHVITYRDGSLNRLDVDSGTEHRLVALATDFRAGEDVVGVPHVDVTRDLNGDGRDDFLVPDVDGFWVSTQRADGSFVDAVKLGPPEPFRDATAYGETRRYGDVGVTPQNVHWYLGRVHEMDYDRDGRVDLVFWNRDHFEVYRQSASGQFAASGDRFATDVPFDFDGAYALAFQFGDASLAALVLGTGEPFEGTVLHGFADLNADGIADLVTLSFEGRSVLRLRGRYAVHFGRPVPGGTEFPSTPDTLVGTPGAGIGMQAWGYASQRFLDFDGDGATDMAMGAVNTGLGGMALAMVGNSVSIDLAVYRLRDGGYPERPDARRTVKSAVAPFDKRGVLFPTVLVGDVNGDGRADLVTGEKWDELSVFLGVPGPDLLDSKAIRVPVAVPADERNARLVDLDRDGKQDVVIHHPSAVEPHRVVVLMAR